MGACKGIKPVKAEEVRREREGIGGMEEEYYNEREKPNERRGREGEGEMDFESPTKNSTLCNRQTTSGMSCLLSNTSDPDAALMPV